MSTIIVFNEDTRLAVRESLDAVRNRWEARDGNQGLMHLTSAKTEMPVAVNAKRVAYFVERDD